MKRRYYVLTAIVSVIFFLVVLFPAKVAWNMVPESVRAGFPLQVSQVGGTLWSGYVVGDLPAGVASGTHAISWDLNPLWLLVGTVSVDLHAEHAGYEIEGTGYTGLIFGKGVDDITGEVHSSVANEMLSQLGAGASGVLKLNEISVAATDEMRVTSADGTISWGGGPITYNDQGYSRTIDMPALLGNLSQQGKGLRLGVVEQKSKGALGELNLDGPIGGVVVLKRVMKIVGMGDPADPDAVLVQLQQPLFL